MNMGFADISSNTSTSTSGIWVLDSAAAYHVVGDMSLFSPSSYLPATPSSAALPPQPTSATAADHAHYDGSRSRSARALTVAGVGTVSCDNFQLAGVLYDPDMGTTGPNRVSVQQLAERGYVVVFGSGGGGGECCSVVEQSSGKIVGEGRLHDDDGLYHLQFLKIPPYNTDDAMDSWMAT